MHRHRIGGLALAVWASAGAAVASPTMIRLGYNDCAVCHVSPQGGGLLTPYGKGIDVAQSLRNREYRPSPGNERFRFDVRLVAFGQQTDDLNDDVTPYKSASGQLQIRSATTVTDRNRMLVTIGIEGAASPRIPSASRSSSLAVPRALWQYRPARGFEVAVGLDELPSGIGLPDSLAFMRAQTDPGASPYPAQVKAFWWNHRFELMPFVFGPGLDERPESWQWGAGIKGGINLGRRAVVGLTARSSEDAMFERQSVGAYARLGRGRWGLLAEHELTGRTNRKGRDAYTGYLSGETLVFVAPWEWLVTTIGGQHVTTSGTHTVRIGPGVQVRVSENLTVVFSVRDVLTDPIRGLHARTYALLLAAKTVD